MGGEGGHYFSETGGRFGVAGAGGGECHIVNSINFCVKYDYPIM